MQPRIVRHRLDDVGGARRYPSLRVEVCYTDRYVDVIAEGFDAVIRLGGMSDSRLVARRIATTRLLLCAAPSYLERRKPLTEAEDLLRHDCVCFTRITTHPVWHLQRNGKNRAIRVAGRLEADDAETTVQAALAGAGTRPSTANRHTPKHKGIYKSAVATPTNARTQGRHQ